MGGVFISISQTKAKLRHLTLDLDTVREKDATLKLQQCQTYDRRHHTQLLPQLKPGQQVWITPTHTSGTVVGSAPTCHSYEVDHEGVDSCDAIVHT